MKIYLPILGLISFLFFLAAPLSTIFASDLGGRAVNIDGRYGGCHGNYYYYGTWGGTDSCQGLPDYTVRLCRDNGSPCRTDPIKDNWDGPRFGWEFGQEDFDATAEPVFANGTNTPDGAVFDHWDSYAIGDYDSKTLYESSGTTLPARIHIYDPLHNGVWFYYKYPTTGVVTSGSPPSATIHTDQSTGMVGQPVKVTATAQDPAGLLIKGELWVSPTNTESWTNVTITNWSSGNTQTLSGTFTPTEAKGYWIVANVFSSNGLKCTGNPFRAPSGWSDCGASSRVKFTAIQKPTLNSLSIQPGTDANPGQVKMSGLRSDDPFLPGKGTNANNSLGVIVNTSNTSKTNTRLMGSAFTNAPPTGNSLYQLTQKTYGRSGFVLVYAPSDTSVTFYNGSWPDPVKSLTGGYYAYYNQQWIGPLILGQSGNIEGIKVVPHSNSGDILEFNVYPYQLTGNRIWKTYGFLWNQSGIFNTVHLP